MVWAGPSHYGTKAAVKRVLAWAWRAGVTAQLEVSGGAGGGSHNTVT